MAKKRDQAAAGIGLRGTKGSEEGTRKKRKAASESAEKIKKIADDEEGSDEDYEDVPAVCKVRAAGKKEVRVEDMPLVAPGFRLWKGFADIVKGTDLARLAKFDADEKGDTEALEVQRRHGMALKPFILTEGPFAGRKILMLETTSSFRFLDLPPEIRLMIYGCLFETDTEIGIMKYTPNGIAPTRPVRTSFRSGSYTTKDGCTWDKGNRKWLGQEPSPNALLAVSKQILEETAPIIYGRNTFAPHSFASAHLFITTLGSMRVHLRKLKLPGDTHGIGKSRSMFKLLADATSLQSVSVGHRVLCEGRYWRRDDQSPEYLAHYMQPLFKRLKQALSTTELSAIRELLDIASFRPAGEGLDEMCRWCIMGEEANCTQFRACNVKCAMQKEHSKAIESRLRSAIAKSLGVEL